MPLIHVYFEDFTRSEIVDESQFWTSPLYFSGTLLFLWCGVSLVHHFSLVCWLISDRFMSLRWIFSFFLCRCILNFCEPQLTR